MGGPRCFQNDWLQGSTCWWLFPETSACNVLPPCKPQMPHAFPGDPPGPAGRSDEKVWLRSLGSPCFQRLSMLNAPGALPPNARPPSWGLEFSLLWESFCNIVILIFGSPTPWVWNCLYHENAPPTVSMWLLVFGCRISFMAASSLFCWWLFRRWTWVLLLCHLSLNLSDDFFFFF